MQKRENRVIYAELRAEASEALAIYEDKPVPKKCMKPIAKLILPKFILTASRKQDWRTSQKSADHRRSSLLTPDSASQYLDGICLKVDPIRAKLSLVNVFH